MPESVQQKLQLPITQGTEIVVEIEDYSIRARCDFIGMRQGQYIMLSFHDTVLRTDQLRDLNVVVRYLYKGTVFGFKSRVMGLLASPERLLVIAYPYALEEFKVRHCQRYECILPATASLEGCEAEAILIDISSEGCRCSIKTTGCANRDAIYNAIELGREASIKVELPGASDKLVLSGAMKNIVKDEGRIVLGVAFASLSEESRKRLESYIFFLSAVKEAQAS
ncbi:MAG TPA: hypothetical protein DDW94_12685 [Deltaproteobacteria bacterium]|nr:MAG: hypothetical protein A2Z79_07090 [Deltaproteobacteria bacterium GWA2_55_82]OGQ63230.1 MAG: hypothetical protein A3I81_00510 [Deltaproteobacteria bacterium RIFCSPLOWO2_02_FULL_55_12]OIJ73065.1 MAG: hypothetical protein A2V21_301575 [Deltaproteobacteria bacterium GWC2_55_46]HBG47826.1 hypothetical protein [Deltaproteobacteria bacterium]HCY11911.1 hypothetical protein [Deltaproteobacteria bacterium]